MSKKGLFIVFDGPDGAGHTTQSSEIGNILTTDLKRPVVITREPTDTNEYGKAARFYSSKTAPKIDPKEHQLHFVKDRELHVAQITQWLSVGLIVLCDRYFYSTIAYGSVDGASWDELWAMNEHFLPPDLTIFFELPAVVAMDRLNNREGEKERFETLDFQTKVSQNYKKLKQLCPEVRTVNATLESKAVTAQILFYLKDLIPEVQSIIDKY